MSNSKHGDERLWHATEPDLEAHWTVRQVAQYLGVSVKWVYASAAKGLLPCRRFGANLRFSPKRIRAWVEAQEWPPMDRK